MIDRYDLVLEKEDTSKDYAALVKNIFGGVSGPAAAIFISGIIPGAIAAAGVTGKAAYEKYNKRKEIAKKRDDESYFIFDKITNDKIRLLREKCVIDLYRLLEEYVKHTTILTQKITKKYNSYYIPC